MKKVVYGFIIIMLIVSAAPQRLFAAENDGIINDAQIVTIRMHCTDLQATLNRLRQSDTLLRYNRGQLYRAIADKLMVPLNQRITSNQLDGSDLVATTAKFNDEYQVFFESYRVYEASLSTTLTIDCSKQPTTFYDNLAITRDNRNSLHDSSNRLVSLTKQYMKQFTQFKKKVLLSNTNQGAINE